MEIRWREFCLAPENPFHYGSAAPLTLLLHHPEKLPNEEEVCDDTSNDAVADRVDVFRFGLCDTVEQPSEVRVRSFYTGEIGLGIVNLAAWPYSILWDPISGADAAKKINFYATVAEMEAKRNKEFKQLDRQLEDGDMDKAVYLKKKREIEDKYSVESAH